MIDSLHSWEDAYFTKHSWIFKKLSTPLGSLKEQENSGRECDLLVKILRVLDKDEINLELKIKDVSNEIWFLQVPKLKFGNFNEGEIVRVRSVEANPAKKRNELIMKVSTNILRFTLKNSIVSEMRHAIKETTEDQLNDDESEVLMNPVDYTEFTNSDHYKLPLFKLDDLFLRYDEIPAEERERNLFRVRFYALRVDPGDAREIVQVMDPKTLKTSSCKDLGDSEKPKVKHGKFIYKVQLMVKDQVSSLNQNFYRVLLYSHSDEYGKDFFKEPAQPCNLYAKSNAEKLAAIENQLKNICRFNVWCDAVLERQNNFFLIRDTRVKTLASD